jgi:hypothetical protein
MNRNSPPTSSHQDDLDYKSHDKRSEVGASSVDEEESKSQTNKQELQQTPGLYISLTTAQAFSIMRNIPMKYRVIERTNFKKQTTRKQVKLESTPKRSKKNKIV